MQQVRIFAVRGRSEVARARLFDCLLLRRLVQDLFHQHACMFLASFGIASQLLIQAGEEVREAVLWDRMLLREDRCYAPAALLTKEI